METFVFEGLVRPRRCRLALTDIWIELPDPYIRVSVETHEETVRICALVEESMVPDMLTLKNDAVEIAQGLIDAHTFVHAADITLEIDRVTLPSGETVDLIAKFTGLQCTSYLGGLSELETSQLLGRQSGNPQLRLALGDLRRASTAGHDTAFLAYRAVESIRQVFASVNDRSRESSWTRMWASLGGGRALVDGFIGTATDRRHGVVSGYTEDERRDALLGAREVVLRFAHWLETGRQPADLANADAVPGLPGQPSLGRTSLRRGSAQPD